MRIILFTNGLDYGGASRFFIRMKEAFEKKNVTNELVTFKNEFDINQDNLMEKGIIKRLIYLRRNLKTRDEVIITNYGLETLIAWIASFGFKNIKILSVVHVRSVLWIPKNMNNFKKIIFKFLIKISFIVCDRCIAVSNELKEELINEKWISSSKIDVIYNPIIDDNFNGTIVEIDKGQQVSIGIIGWIWDIKNQLEAIKAIHQLNNANVKLKIIGGIKDEVYYQQLLKYINDNNLRDRVEFCGLKKNIFEEYKKLDILVLCSITEALPTVIIEALSCGIPVIAANCPVGPTEILNNSNYGIIYDLGDVDMLVESIEVLINEIDIYHHYSKQGIKRAKDFTYSSAVNQYLKIINTI